MKSLLLTVLVILTSVSYGAEIRCGLPDVSEYPALYRFVRPDNQTFYESESGRFYVHYDTVAVDSYDHTPLEGDENNNGIPDFVEQVAVMADSSYDILVGVMGYDPYPTDADGKYDIYLRDDLDPSWYGVTYFEGDGVSYIVIDNDFSPEENFSTTGYDAMMVTTVHELFHAIQFGYTSSTSGNVYFYEMSSTWFEDVIVPQVNDYLTLRSNFFNDPQKNINSTNGYSIALYGHYLSRVVDGFPDEKDSEILRVIWTDFGNSSHHTALTSLKTQLNSVYGIPFIETWLDWVSLNLYNNVDEYFYYYEDQGEIGPVLTTPVPLYNSTNFNNLLLDDRSAAIRSFRVVNSSTRLEIELDGANYTGFVAVVSANSENNIIYPATDLIMTDILEAGDTVHFIIGTESSGNTVDGSIRIYYTPLPPENLFAIPVQDSIRLRWDSSDGPGEIISYSVFRSWTDPDTGGEMNLVFTADDTTFFDSDITGNTLYTYQVSARNLAGLSEKSSPVSVTSWPAAGDVNATAIVKVYPNPIRLDEESIAWCEVELSKDYSRAKISLINILGQRVYQKTRGAMSQGRHRITIADFGDKNPSSGIYFLEIELDGKRTIRRPITILK